MTKSGARERGCLTTSYLLHTFYLLKLLFQIISLVQQLCSILCLGKVGVRDVYINKLLHLLVAQKMKNIQVNCFVTIHKPWHLRQWELVTEDMCVHHTENETRSLHRFLFSVVSWMVEKTVFIILCLYWPEFWNEYKTKSCGGIKLPVVRHTLVEDGSVHFQARKIGLCPNFRATGIWLDKSEVRAKVQKW